MMGNVARNSSLASTQPEQLTHWGLVQAWVGWGWGEWGWAACEVRDPHPLARSLAPLADGP